LQGAGTAKAGQQAGDAFPLLSPTLVQRSGYARSAAFVARSTFLVTAMAFLTRCG